MKFKGLIIIAPMNGAHLDHAAIKVVKRACCSVAVALTVT